MESEASITDAVGVVGDAAYKGLAEATK